MSWMDILSFTKPFYRFELKNGTVHTSTKKGTNVKRSSLQSRHRSSEHSGHGFCEMRPQSTVLTHQVADAGAEAPIACWAVHAWTWALVHVADAVVTGDESALSAALWYSGSTHDDGGGLCGGV